jgi:prepilin-type N-terminal cleavage/methylation domain-containing protein
MKSALRTITQVTGRGVTLIEMLVVMLIISLLATAALPVFIARIEDSRRTTAQLEVAEIAKAQTLVAIAPNVYVPLQVLNDLPDRGAFSVTPADGDPSIINSANRNWRLVRVDLGAKRQLDGNLQPLLSTSDSEPQGQKVVREWRGPFLNPQRVWVGTGSANDRRALDHPMDPWGNPYRFYSPIGIIGTGALSTTATSYSTQQFSNGVLTENNNRFDRYAIVSFGADGVPDPVNNLVDDVVYTFGIDPNESTFSLF